MDEKLKQLEINDWTIIEECSRYECSYLYWYWATGKVNYCNHPTRDGKKCFLSECPLRKEIIQQRLRWEQKNRKEVEK